MSPISDIDAAGAVPDASCMTLAELLAALLMVGVLLGGVVGLLQSGERVYTLGSGRLESQQNARIGLDRLTREIRQAGFGGPAESFAAVSVAEPTRIVLQSDLNRDGVISGNPETVTWRLVGSVLRRDAGGGAQPVIDGVRRFELAYFDERGTPTTIASAVRTVAIRLETEPESLPAGLGAPTRIALTARVRLRNR